MEKQCGRVGLGEDRDGPFAVFGSGSRLGLGSAHEDDAGSEVRLAVLDAAIEIFVGHPRHFKGLTVPHSSIYFIGIPDLTSSSVSHYFGSDTYAQTSW